MTVMGNINHRSATCTPASSSTTSASSSASPRCRPTSAPATSSSPASTTITLRRALHNREGADEAEHQIRQGRRAWAVERWTGHPDYRQRLTAIVFGKSRSDALRRASAPARLGEEMHGDTTEAVQITSGWDNPIVWPIRRESARERGR